MATSTNYGWAEPDNSSLVKNGASDIRTLGNAIDTSVWNVGFGQAGKNKFINGDFGIWQRGTSFTTAAGEAYTSDRWVQYSNGSMTTSQQTFTAGTAPVTGYEGTFYQRLTTSATNVNASLRQKIEGVRTFANQTVTLSYYIKGSGAFTATPMIRQNFGTSGSTSVDTTNGTVSVTTAWTRVTKTITIPSISGKTLGTGNCLEVFLYSFSDTIPVSGTIDIWGVQIEYGSLATPFQTATGTIQGELAACQRYYWRFGGDSTYQIFGFGVGSTATSANIGVQFPVPMRVSPTSVDYSLLGLGDTISISSAVSSLAIGNNSKFMTLLNVASTSLTSRHNYFLRTDGSLSGYLGFSAEL
jgi:hypothetical protein